MIERRTYPRSLVPLLVAKINTIKVPVKNISKTGISLLWPNNQVPKNGEQLNLEFKLFGNSYHIKGIVRRSWMQSIGVEFETPIFYQEADPVLFGESLKEIAAELGLDIKFRWYKGATDSQLFIQRNEQGAYSRIEYFHGNRVLSYSPETGLQTGVVKGYEENITLGDVEIKAIQFDPEINKAFLNLVKNILNHSKIEDKNMILTQLHNIQ